MEYIEVYKELCLAIFINIKIKILELRFYYKINRYRIMLLVTLVIICNI